MQKQLSAFKDSFKPKPELPSTNSQLALSPTWIVDTTACDAFVTLSASSVHWWP